MFWHSIVLTWDDAGGVTLVLSLVQRTQEWEGKVRARTLRQELIPGLWEDGGELRIWDPLQNFKFFFLPGRPKFMPSLISDEGKVEGPQAPVLGWGPPSSALPWSWSKSRTGTKLRKVRHSPGAQKFRGCPQILVIKINMILMQYLKNQNECKHLQ